MFFGSLFLIGYGLDALLSDNDQWWWLAPVSPILIYTSVTGLAVAYASKYVPTAQVSLGTLIGGLTSVSVKVPPWVRAHPSARLIRVPASGRIISTVSFTPTPEVIDTLISRAASHVQAELTALPLGSNHTGKTLQQPDVVRFVMLPHQRFRTSSLRPRGQLAQWRGVSSMATGTPVDSGTQHVRSARHACGGDSASSVARTVSSCAENCFRSATR